MSKVYNFLKECGVFYVLTAKGDVPNGRPFGAVMEYENQLYFSTANTKSVYEQLINNPNIQIVALKAGTRDWIRISGQAIECKDLAMKERMIEACPVLNKRFDSATCEYFALFVMEEMDAYLNTDNGSIKIE